MNAIIRFKNRNKMKHIKIKSILYMLLLSSPMMAQAEKTQDLWNLLSQDSINTELDEVVQVAYRKVNSNDILGGVSYVNVNDMLKKNYTTYSLNDMQNFANGWNGTTLWGNDSYLVLVDGIPRDANNVMPSEIEQITFLKSSAATVLYGSRAAKGVIYITTKRGKTGDLNIDVRGNTGFHVPIRYPKYLGSAEYMTLYNEARMNDGLDPIYSQEEIYNYASGSNPYRYPNIDLYSSEYLKKAYNESDVTAEISGGSERTRFYTNVNLYNVGSLLNYGEASKDRTTRFSVRGNIDMKMGEYVQAYANANATFYDGRSARGNFWDAAANLRPNRIAPLIPIDYFSKDNEDLWLQVQNTKNLIDGKYLLGGTQIDQTNALADLYVAGTSTYTSRQYQFDMGVDIDLCKILKGLTFQTRFAIDYATSYSKFYSNSYATFNPTWINVNGEDKITGLTKYGNDYSDGVQYVSGSWNRQTISFSSQFNYAKSIENKHNINAMLVAAGYQQGESGVYHKTSNVNLGIQLDYDFMKKYYVSFGGALVHSARLPKNNRNAFSPALTLGWRLSNEKFLSNSSVVDDLLLTASASILHTDLDISDYYMYESTYDQNNGSWWGWADSGLNRATESKRGANHNLDFIKKKEFNIGIRGSLFDKMLSFDVSYFMHSLEGLIVRSSTVYPSYFSSWWPGDSFIPYMNYNNNERKGFDFALCFDKMIDKVNLNIGLTGTYYTSKQTRLDEKYDYDYQYRKGHPIDGVWGLQTEGFFKDETEIAHSASSSYGELKPGDLKYVDQNGDGIIDDKDIVYLGERYGWQGAPFTMGVNLTLNWKNLTFFALGTAYIGGVGMKNSNYYWVYGDRKYSEIVRGRWTPETAETATYPRLTTQNNTHNFRDSDFWMYKTNRFNLSKIQVTYDFPYQILGNTFIKSLSVYAYASNLLTIAKERDILELTTGGSPQNRFYNIGFKIGF